MVKSAFSRDPVTKELQADAFMLVGDRLKSFCEQIKAGECFRVSLPISNITIDGRPAQMSLLARKYQGEDAETATYRVPARTGNLAGKFQTIFEAAGERAKDGVIFDATGPVRVEIVFEEFTVG